MCIALNKQNIYFINLQLCNWLIVNYYKILDLLGPHYKHMEVEERQQILKSQYFFTCKCDKCVSPKSDSLKPYSALRCINCEGPIFKDTFNCASCNKRQPAVELMNMSLNACSIAAQGKKI